MSKKKDEAFVMIDGQGEPVSVVVLEHNGNLAFTYRETGFQISETQMFELFHWVASQKML